MSMFHVGQRVVCINDRRRGLRPLPFGCSLPKQGCVYTVRDIFPDPFDGRILLLLEEIINPMLGRIEYGYDASHFSPVKETSIEVFRKLLLPLPEKEDA